MSKAEQQPQGALAPIYPIEEIVDQEGLSIIEVSQEQVERQKKLGEHERTSMLHNEAFNAAADSKVDQAEGFTYPGAQIGERAAALTLIDDANTLRLSAIDSRNTAYDLRHEMEEQKERSSEHARENLPEYIDVAARLANSDLHSRVGLDVPISTKDGSIVGTKKVELVDPATKNEDISS